MSCRETDEAEEEREREAGRSLSEQTVLTEVQDEDEAPRSPDDIILPTIPLRDETEEGRLAAVLLGDLWLPRRDPSGMVR